MQNAKLQFKVQNFIIPGLIIIFAALLRLVPHPANFTPIVAMALFGGCYLDRRIALVLPLAAMLLADTFLGFHQSMPYVYGGILLTSAIGMWLAKRKTVTNVLLASIGSSALFFLITNFNYWLPVSLYPKTFSGQVTAYIMALPFFRNSLLGDLLYTGLFFGGYAVLSNFMKRKVFVKG